MALINGIFALRFSKGVGNTVYAALAYYFVFRSHNLCYEMLF
jgi:hypothetical protein